MNLTIEPSKDNVNLKRIIKSLCSTSIRYPLNYEDVKAWLKQFDEGPEETLALLILRYLIYRTSEQLESSLTQALKKTALFYMQGAFDPTEVFWKDIFAKSDKLDFSFGPPHHEYTGPGKSGELIARTLKRIIPAEICYLKDRSTLQENERFILVDDGIYTGEQLKICLDALDSDSRIISNHPHQIGILVAIAHQSGIDLLGKHYPSIPIFYGEILTDEDCFAKVTQKWVDDGIWPYSERTPLETYEYVFKNKAQLPALPLGWDNLGCIVAYQHGIPDDSLALLHGKSESWSPLFRR